MHFKESCLLTYSIFLIKIIFFHEMIACFSLSSSWHCLIVHSPFSKDFSQIWILTLDSRVIITRRPTIVCGTLMQVVKADLFNGLNLHEGRAWRGCCNTNSKELEVAGWGIPKVLLQGSALDVHSLFPGLGDWFWQSESSCMYNAHLIFGWLAATADRRASLSHLQWSRSGGQLCCRIWSETANSFHTDFPTASRQGSAGCYGPGLDSSWQLKHEKLHMPACPLSH